MNFLKRSMLVFFGFIFILLFIAAVFINTSPEFGGMHLEDRVQRYQESGLYVDGKFQNQIPTPMEMGFGKVMSILADFIKGNPNRVPQIEIPVLKLDPSSIGTLPNDSTRITWLGHSSFIIETQGKVILLDPMFSQVPAPHPWLGQNRFYSEMPITIEELPEIDVVLYSHDHYDHLDYQSVLKLKAKTKRFFAPLGLGAHLQKWGVDKNKVFEFSWWDEEEVEGIQFTSTPARHFSGRGIADRFSTLWCSWVIQTSNESIYFSGDTGYGPHFKEIQSKFGQFDIALLECGQYDERWSEIHMLPQQTVQAAIDLNAKIMMPIHWGAFTLSLHDWNDPAIKSTQFAKEVDVNLFIPKIGESVMVKQSVFPTKQWWLQDSN